MKAINIYHVKNRRTWRFLSGFGLISLSIKSGLKVRNNIHTVTVALAN